MSYSAAVYAEGVGRSFMTGNGEVKALKGCNLSLDYGRFVSVLGPSGCGKSTLLALIGLLDRPTAGRLEIAGENILELSPNQLALQRRKTVGFLFQDAGLIDRMSALENVCLPLEYRGQTDRRGIATEALINLGLEHRLNTRVEKLSGGERQRVALARILATKPKIVVCDEPTASLDKTNSLLVVHHLQALADEGALVICASHDPIVLDHTRNRIVLSHGEVVEAPLAC